MDVTYNTALSDEKYTHNFVTKLQEAYFKLKHKNVYLNHKRACLTQKRKYKTN